jgi:hypothetical protein
MGLDDVARGFANGGVCVTYRVKAKQVKRKILSQMV